MKSKFILFIVTIFIFGVTGCYDYIDMEEVGYVISIGIDKEVGVDEFYYTFQCVKPSAIAAGANNSGSNSSINNVSVKAHDLSCAINVLNQHIGRKVTLSHVKLLLLSDELECHSLIDLTGQLFENFQLRPGISVIMTLGKTLPFLNDSTIADHTKYYEFINKFGVNGDLSVNLGDLSNEMLSQSHTILLPALSTKDLNENDKENGKENNKNSYEFSALEKDFDKTTAILINQSKHIELSRFEVSMFELLNSNKKNIAMLIENVGNISVDAKSNPKYKINFMDSQPIIDINLHLKLDYIYKNSNIDREKISLVLGEELTKFSNKIARDNFDILKLGRKATRQFLTWKDWERQNWTDIYKNSKFNIKVKCDL